MYVKRNYGFWLTLNWSKWPFIWGAIYGFAVYIIIYYTEIQVPIPWAPIGVIGIAVAFYLGFKNNSSYDRTWEARKIWGSIVNNSRSLGAAIIAFVQGDDTEAIQKELIYRHIAWLTALRHQLRMKREWEHVRERTKAYRNPTVRESFDAQLDDELAPYLSEEEIAYLDSKSNKATQILRKQSQRLQELRDKEYFEDFRHMEFHSLIVSFYADQGKSERIKNFPFPRQYASTALWLTVIFCIFVPFGLLDAFQDKEPWMLWLCPFLTGLICWIFFLMEKVGDYSENPFEGTYNDVPITSIAKGIEIDMREMINDTNIPEPTKAVNGFLM